MNCKNCGREIMIGQKFCQDCGKRIEEETTEVPGEVSEAPETVKVERKETPVPKKRGSKLPVILIAEIALLIMAAFFLPAHLKKSFSAETRAEKFFVSLANGDYDAAYEMYGFDRKEEGLLLNKEMFRRLYTDSGLNRNLSQVVNYVVEKEEGMDLPFLKKEDITKDVGISFVRKETSGEERMTVHLVKGRDKKYFFFDDWKIDSSNMLSLDTRIKVQEGSKIRVDGIPIPESFAKFNEEEGLLVYELPPIFKTEHKIEVEKEGRENYQGKFDVNFGSEFTFTEMLISDRIAGKLSELATDNMKKIYGAAKTGEDFASIRSLFIPDSETAEHIENGYKELVESFDGEKKKIKGFELKNVKTSITNKSTRVLLNFDYELNYQAYRGGIFSEPKWEDDTASGSMELFFDFEEVGGRWLQRNLGNKVLSTGWW